jgi:WD40 repeat protein
MRQLALLPSGCHVREIGDRMFFSRDRIYYGSTLAVYILNAHTFSVEKILPCGPKTICSMSVCPLNQNMIAVSCIDGFVCVWDVDADEMTHKISLKFQVNIIWDFSVSTTCTLVSKDVNSVKVYIW